MRVVKATLAARAKDYFHDVIKGTRYELCTKWRASPSSVALFCLKCVIDNGLLLHERFRIIKICMHGAAVDSSGTG